MAKNCENCENKRRCNKQDVVRNMPCIDYEGVKRDVQAGNRTRLQQNRVRV